MNVRAGIPLPVLAFSSKTMLKKTSKNVAFFFKRQDAYLLRKHFQESGLYIFFFFDVVWLLTGLLSYLFIIFFPLSLKSQIIFLGIPSNNWVLISQTIGFSSFLLGVSIFIGLTISVFSEILRY